MSLKDMFTVRMSGLSDSTLVDVLEALAVCKNSKTGQCFPSTERIAFLSRRSVKVTRKALKQLTDLGYVSQTQNPGGKRFFSLHLEKLQGDEELQGGEEPQGGEELQGEGMKFFTGTPCKSSRGGGAKVHPESGINQEVNQEVNQEDLPPPSPAAKREAQTHLFSLSEIPDASKEKTRTHQAFKPPELGVELTESAFRDWMTVRKAKHSPLTETAWKHFKAQVLRSELSIQQAVELCATKGWISINAEWQAVKDYQAEFDSRSSNDRKVDFVIKALGLTDNRKETEK